MIKSYTALLIIDVQVGSFKEKRILYKGIELLKNIQLLIHKARTVQAPIFHMKFNGKPGSLLEHGNPEWVIHESIAPLSEDKKKKKNTLIHFMKQVFNKN